MFGSAKDQESPRLPTKEEKEEEVLELDPFGELELEPSPSEVKRPKKEEGKRKKGGGKEKEKEEKEGGKEEPLGPGLKIEEAPATKSVVPSSVPQGILLSAKEVLSSIKAFVA